MGGGGVSRRPPPHPSVGKGQLFQRLPEPSKAVVLLYPTTAGVGFSEVGEVGQQRQAPGRFCTGFCLPGLSSGHSLGVLTHPTPLTVTSLVSLTHFL